jgi:predicted P-loop ATPase/GTPase
MNPLQKYFRQPKVYIKLPSGGLYSKPGTFSGDVSHMPIYGMTGMDEIILKTPDALLSGESTVAVMQSCCPVIKDPWEVSVIDIMMVLTAIRIATFGNEMTIEHTCSCGAENEYEVDLNKVIEHYMKCVYNNSVDVGEITIKLQPLTYKQSTEFNLKNFQLQQRMAQAEVLEEVERQPIINELFKELADTQTEIFKQAIESVEMGNQVVTERKYINEWLENCDKAVFDAIKKQNLMNNKTWEIPRFPVKCDACGTEVALSVDLDESNFFVQA